MDDKFKNCKSYAEFGRLLGFEYYNKHVKNKIVEFCIENNLDLDNIIKYNTKQPNKCLFCGKVLEGRNRFTKHFCNSSCAASYNNKLRGSLSDEVKQKIRTSLLEKSRNDYRNKNFLTLSELIAQGLVLNPLNVAYDDKYIQPYKYKIRKCKICGKEFHPSLTKNGLISKSNTCSAECHKAMASSNSKVVMNRLLNEGRHQGWKSRKIVSYPERFWMTVLSNNNIEYKHNFPFGKYFLDFYIEFGDRKIDLEIDGKQHEYVDRKKNDIERDKFVTSNGIEIYRIKWNSINTDKGKLEMKEKIKNFIDFYNKR